MTTTSIASANDARPTMWASVSAVFLRFLLPAYILLGAVTKLLYAKPADLPQWIQSWLLSTTTIATDIRPMLLSVIITVELLAILVMLLLPRFAKAAGVFILTAFIFVLLAEVVHLANRYPLMEALFDGSCGCFGTAVAIPPGVMLIVDVVLLGAVLAASRRQIARIRIGSGSLIAFIALGLVSAALAFQTPLIRTERHLTQEELGDNVLRPQLWIGKQFSETPLARIVDLDPTMLGGGRQHWIFYRKSCSVCHGLFEREYASDELPDGLTAIVAIEVPHPAGAPPISEEDILCPTCEFVSLDSAVDWLVSTPGTVIIEDGIVVDFIDGQLSELNVHGDEI